MGRRKRHKQSALPPIVPVAAVPYPSRDPEWTPTLSLNRQIAQARREMGEERWSELNKEWK